MKDFIRWSFRWPAPLHKIATEIARKNNRSLNEQVQHWLENGTMAEDMRAEEIGHMRMAHGSLLMEALRSPPGIKEQKLIEAELIRERLDAMSEAQP